MALNKPHADVVLYRVMTIVLTLLALITLALSLRGASMVLAAGALVSYIASWVAKE